MLEETEFTIGAQARCSDGLCGEVNRIVIDPATRAVTHLVIDPRHHHRMPGRLVPVDLVDSASGEVRIRCTLAEFGNLEPAESAQLVEGIPSGLGPAGMPTPLGIPHAVEATVEDVVPRGETELRPGERVHAVDGEIGEVQGFAVDPDDHRVTHVLLKEGHLWGRKKVAIPVSAISGLRNGVVLNITKKQVADLPPLGH
jgi:sporulation protein YlmC with PRC-barrel domain